MFSTFHFYAALQTCIWQLLTAMTFWIQLSALSFVFLNIFSVTGICLLHYPEIPENWRLGYGPLPSNYVKKSEIGKFLWKCVRNEYVVILARQFLNGCCLRQGKWWRSGIWKCQTKTVSFPENLFHGRHAGLWSRDIDVRRILRPRQNAEGCVLPWTVYSEEIRSIHWNWHNVCDNSDSWDALCWQ